MDKVSGLSARGDGASVADGALGFDAILGEVLSQVDDVLHEQVRLRLLVDAVVSLNADVSLDGVLTGMAETAARLVDAGKAAIAVFTPAPARRLRTFVHRGMSAGQADTLIALSTETGLLDLLLDQASPVRLADLLGRADGAGVGRERVPVRSFLGVPVRTRDEVLGVLYLADRVGGGDFTESDEQLVVALATAAGVAVDNARLHAAAVERQRWLEATAEVVALLSDRGLDAETGRMLACRARATAGADLAWVASGADRASLELRALDGFDLDAAGLADVDLGQSLVGQAVADGAAVVAEDLGVDAYASDADTAEAAEGRRSLGRVVVVPMSSHAGVVGGLGLGWWRDRDDVPEPVDPDLVASFAEQAALAVRVATAHAERQRLALFEDRGRIGARLHEVVIQRLFGIGLGLESAARLSDRPAVTDRLAVAVDSLDRAIRDLRRSVFDLDDDAR